jgi:Domain of unknown function (DUF6473)
MSKYYQSLDQGHFDYDLQALPGLAGRHFRGPGIDPSRPFFACIGAAQTFGRFCERPYPTLLSERLGMPVLNLAVGGAGPRLFGRPEFLEWINRAEFVVVQVMSARSESNSRFDNTATDGLVGVRTSDRRKMRFEEFLADLVAAEPRDVVREIVDETRENYVLGFSELLRRIFPPKVLLWLSKRSPGYQEDYSMHYGILGDFPQLVTAAMLERVQAHADAFVSCISTNGLPQRLWPANGPIDGTQIRDGELVNQYYPSPDMHEEAARHLAPVCGRLVSGWSGL